MQSGKILLEHNKNIFSFHPNHILNDRTVVLTKNNLNVAN